jgi:glycosyltransferase involved in cell wall biosynthesis
MKKTNKPLVSIILPVFNAQDFLSEAIESIISQTYKNIELIIVDDSSTDDSYSIAANYKNKYPDLITLLRSKRHLNKEGEASSNIGLNYAKGKYIARMDADDISCPTRIEKQVKFLESHPNIFLVASNAHIIDREGNMIGEKIETSKSQEIYKEYLSFRPTTVNPIINPSTMCHAYDKDKKKFKYDIKYPAANDYYTLIKLICNDYRFYNIQEKLIYYRVHGRNNTLTRIKEKCMLISRIRLEMAIKYNYRPAILDSSLMIAQAIVLAILPQKIILSLYLIIKGITDLNIIALFSKKPAKIYPEPTFAS